MQMMVEPTVSTPIVDEAAARCAANEYIHANLGTAYWVEQGFFRNLPPRTVWRYLVIHHEYDAVAGYIDVDAETGKIIPLDDEQLQDLHERAVVIEAKSRKTIARTEHGYILPFLAKTRVNGYLSRHIAFFASASGQPTFVASNPPVWRVTTALRLSDHDQVIELGVVEVNALTGEVIPLPEHQLQTMQNHAQDVAATLECSATAAG
jgi:hypothetical protein